jgi:hypothetical protein
MVSHEYITKNKLRVYYMKSFIKCRYSYEAMATERVIVELRAFLRSISNASVMHFESGFENIHMTWHRNFMYNGKPIGFLSFHHEVVNARNALIRKLGGTPPLPWKGRNNPPGDPPLPAGPLPRYPGTWIQRSLNGPPPRGFGDRNPPPLNNISDPRKFSQYIELWHNEVHSNRLYDPQFGNPQVNVHMRLFWNWHALMEQLFLGWMRNHNLTYDSIDHRIV